MAILEVTSRQFRDKQKLFFDLADTGKQIVIRRRGKQTYILTPVNVDDFQFSSEALERIEKSRQQAQEGKYTECLTAEESIKHLESL